VAQFREGIKVMKVKLKANDGATRRTKNRVRQHGPNFEDVSRDLTGQPPIACTLFRAADGWLGWLPVNELKIVEISS